MRAAIQRLLFGRPVSHATLPVLPGKPLTFAQANSSPSYVIGGTVYPMAAGLCHLLLAEQTNLGLGAGPSTLEIGAGTGAVGIFAAALGARATVTDKMIARAAAQPVSYSADGHMDVLSGTSDVLLELLQSNVDANQQSAAHRIRVAPLDWMDPDQVEAVADSSPAGGGFSLILGSDVTYERASHHAMVLAIKRLLRRPTSACQGGLALIAHETRRVDALGADIQLASFARYAEAEDLEVESNELPNVQEGSTGTLLKVSHRAIVPDDRKYSV
eukprot:CAMPEP_0115852670 /NCGR_PEP_ID=MMETSP0287-20121206/13115_1 /TAXON_ID=412157 /ORGANISM="Chrysochromulina rotalis, Strain UIO044" /LENGTH=272 /DNA_ID=CAMNT_0003306737 /DNA_START=314 /DNA_END=1132 /DNA_ORIENTATION=-